MIKPNKSTIKKLDKAEELYSAGAATTISEACATVEISYSSWLRHRGAITLNNSYYPDIILEDDISSDILTLNKEVTLSSQALMDEDAPPLAQLRAREDWVLYGSYLSDRLNKGYSYRRVSKVRKDRYENPCLDILPLGVTPQDENHAQCARYHILDQDKININNNKEEELRPMPIIAADGLHVAYSEACPVCGKKYSIQILDTLSPRNRASRRKGRHYHPVRTPLPSLEVARCTRDAVNEHYERLHERHIAAAEVETVKIQEILGSIATSLCAIEPTLELNNANRLLSAIMEPLARSGIPMSTNLNHMWDITRRLPKIWTFLEKFSHIAPSSNYKNKQLGCIPYLSTTQWSEKQMPITLPTWYYRDSLGKLNCARGYYVDTSNIDRHFTDGCAEQPRPLLPSHHILLRPASSNEKELVLDRWVLKEEEKLVYECDKIYSEPHVVRSAKYYKIESAPLTHSVAQKVFSAAFYALRSTKGYSAGGICGTVIANLFWQDAFAGKPHKPIYGENND